MKKICKTEKGITLIALVITIIVLLILAGVSIAMLTGENGILTKATQGKEETEQAQVEEMVRIAINSLQTENLGDSSKITPKAIADQVNEENNRTDVHAENETTFPTNIIFPEEDRKVNVNLDLTIGDTENNDEIYSIDVDPTQIAPQDLFNYEVIEETASKTKVASVTNTALPTKEARITGIKPEYCNENGYDPVTQTTGKYTDTNYGINYSGITDTLIIPYQLEIDGEMFTVTEVSLRVYSDNSHLGGEKNEMSGIPKIENIIFPNTVTTIDMFNGSTANNDVTKKIILSENITKIDKQMFYRLSNLQNVTIPYGVTNIEGSAFAGCNSLTNITIPQSVTEIGYNAFGYCDNLKAINIKNTQDSISGEPWGAYDATINWNYQGE